MTDTDLAVYEPTSRLQRHLISSAVACKIGAPGKSGNCIYPGISEIHADQPMLECRHDTRLAPRPSSPSCYLTAVQKTVSFPDPPEPTFSGNNTSSEFDFLHSCKI